MAVILPKDGTLWLDYGRGMEQRLGGLSIRFGSRVLLGRGSD